MKKGIYLTLLIGMIALPFTHAMAKPIASSSVTSSVPTVTTTIDYLIKTGQWIEHAFHVDLWDLGFKLYRLNVDLAKKIATIFARLLPKLTEFLSA